MERRFIWRVSYLLIFTTAAFGLYLMAVAESNDNQTYILDKTGEKWDVSQAQTLGFKPEEFQYGIGRHAFKTLDDSHLESNPSSVPEELRVIGVAEGNEAQAYSVAKLRSHEIANTMVGSRPIAVGY